MKKENRYWFVKGVRDGLPICFGYFAVAFALGISAKNAGFSPLQATLTSLLLNASAGEYAGFTLISAGAGYLEVMLMEAIANARYLLMSCALSQKLSPDAPLWQRMLLGFDVTDELFGISVAVEGKLNPFYTFGAMSVSIPGWSLGTLFGVLLGNVLPLRAVSALSVGLYGMFLAIIIPPARKNRVVAGAIVVSFVLSYLFNTLPCFDFISSGIKIIVLTVVISLAAAFLFPVKEA